MRKYHIQKGFKLAVSGKIKPFRTAETPLKTILRNLISNAIKHHDKSQGNIEIKLFTEGSYNVYEIKDDGPGIPKVAQARIFKLFQTLAKNNESSGIGLALSKRMAEAHGGHIALFSAEGARGSMFRVYWPKVEVHKQFERLSS